MALSGREVLLVLRARDEASRTLRRVSRNMARMDRDAAMASGQMISTQRASLTQLSRDVGDVGASYRAAALQAHELHRVQQETTGRQLGEVRRQVDAVNAGYRDAALHAQNLRATNAISAREYERQMASARKLKNQQLDVLRQERYAIEDVRRANLETYRARMTQLQGLRNEQLETIRRQKIQAQDAVKFHQQQLADIEEQRAAIRQRGYALIDNGAAVATFGAGMTLAGVLGVRAMAATTKAAMDYETQARRTLTQTDQVQVSLAKIEKIGMQVGKTVPAAFGDMQGALYDIYSSIDTTVRGSQRLLKQFAKDAVGGQSTLETATRANLQIMNAYKVEQKDAAKVSDFMFQLVRKGVGTYDEFAKTIGRAIPSAVRAGQSYRTLGAMMAFMTRNGVSAAMAATSSARALDAISHPETVKRLGEIGINVKKANGEFKPLKIILGDMNKEFGKMTSPQRAKALQELLKGSGGTIQARRFFDSYFKNAQEFNQRTDEMKRSAGAAEEAFNTMAESPQAKLQMLKNQWEVLKIELGKGLMPVVTELLSLFGDLLGWFNDLPKGVKKAIAIFAALSFAVIGVMGVLTILAGALMMIGGAAAVIGISTGALVGIFGGIAAAVGILLVVGYKLYKNWDKIAPVFKRVGDAIQTHLGAAVDWVKRTFGPGFESIVKQVKRAWNDFTASAKRSWEEFKRAVDVEGIKKDFEDLKRKFAELRAALEGAAPGINNVARLFGFLLANNIRAVATAIRIFANIVGGVLGGAIRAVMSFVGDIASAFGHVIRAISAGVKMVQAVLRGDWRQAWTQAKQVTANMMLAILKVVQAPFKAIVKYAIGLKNGVVGAFRALQNILVGNSIVPEMVNAIVKWFRGLPGKVASAIAGMPGRVVNFFNNMRSRALTAVGNLVSQAVSRMKALPGKVAGAIAGLPARVGTIAVQAVTRFGTPLRTLAGQTYGIGSNIMSGLVAGMDAWMDNLASIAARAASLVASVIKARMKMKSPSKVMKNIGQNIVAGLVQGIDGSLPSLKGVMNKVADAIDARKEGGKEREKKAVAWIKKAAAGDIKRLTGVANKLKGVRAELEKQKEALENLRQEAQNYREGVKEGILSFANLSSFEKLTEERTTTDAEGNTSTETVELAWTPARVMQVMRGKLQQIRRWKNTLDKLRSMGFNKWILDQLVQMGPDSMELAQALLDASPGEMAEMNEMTNTIRENANTIADAAKEDMYGVGLEAMEGLVQGLQSQEAALIDQVQKIGAIIGKKIRKALKIKSPSKVMLDIGHNVGSSLASAIAAEEAAVARASTRLGSAAIPGVGGPVVGANGGGPGGPAKQVNQTVNVYTNEIDPRANAAKLGWELANRV